MSLDDHLLREVVDVHSLWVQRELVDQVLPQHREVSLRFPYLCEQEVPAALFVMIHREVLGRGAVDEIGQRFGGGREDGCSIWWILSYCAGGGSRFAGWWTWWGSIPSALRTALNEIFRS